MKSIPGEIQTGIDTAIGTAPYTVVTVSWSTGDVSYTDNDKILDAGTVGTTVRLGMISDIQNISVTLDDTDGSLKTKYNTERIEGIKCVVYQMFSGSTQKVPIVTGRIIGDIIWSEGERQLSFNVESSYESENIGYAPEAGDVDGLTDDAIGIPWPIVFGNMLHSKTVQIRKSFQGSLAKIFTHTNSKFYVTYNANRTPPSGEVTVRVSGIRFSGTFNTAEKTFEVSAVNLPYYTSTDVSIGPREDSTLWSQGSSSVMYVTDETVRLTGLFCLVKILATNKYMVNQCIRQEGKKCFFFKTWRTHLSVAEHILNPTKYEFIEAAPIPRTSWPETYHTDTILSSGEDQSSLLFRFLPRFHIVVASMSLPRDQFRISEGAKVVVESDYNDLYVANLVSSSTVKGVFAYRSIDGVKEFLPVPYTYYTVHKNMSLAGHTITAIEIENPLQMRLGENWESEIYVTLSSSIGNNIVQGIKWLVDNYTDLSMDTTTYEATRVSSLPYPVAYTIYDQPSAIKLAADVAYLGRLAMIIRDGKVYLKYLSKEWTASKTLDEDNTEYKSMELTSTITEDIYTHIKGKWSPDHSGRVPDPTVTYENNTDIFGVREKSIDVFTGDTLHLTLGVR